MIGFVDAQTLPIKLYHKCPKYSIVLMRLANKNIEAMRQEKSSRYWELCYLFATQVVHHATKNEIAKCFAVAIRF